MLSSLNHHDNLKDCSPLPRVREAKVQPLFFEGMYMYKVGDLS